MINNVILTGKIVELPGLKETASGISYATVILDVSRPFKNHDGINEIDRISVTLWKGVAETVYRECKLNDLLGVKGRIQTYSIEKESRTYYNYEIVAEKVSMLAND